MTAPLKPKAGVLFVVRWVSGNRRDIKHKYFRRLFDAEQFALKLDEYGKTTAVFAASVEWTEVEL